MSDRREHVAAVVAELFDDVNWYSPDGATARFEGVDVVVRPSIAGGQGHVGQHREVRGIDVDVPIGHRAMAMRLDLRSRTSSSWPKVTTGDAEFDDRFLTQGFPSEAVRAALTDDMRRWIERTYPNGWPNIEVSNGTASIMIRLIPPRDHRRNDPWTEADDVRGHVAAIVAIAQGMASGYDQAREDARQRGGDAEAARWEAAQADVMAAMAARRTRIRVVVLLVLVGIVLGSMAAVAASSGLL